MELVWMITTMVLCLITIVALVWSNNLSVSSFKTTKEMGNKLDMFNRSIGELQAEKENLIALLQDKTKDAEYYDSELQKERERNRVILSQKKSNETRLGQISEHLIPFLGNCRHNPKNMHFCGNPIDYIAYDYDEGAITFIEVKSGNSKATKRQKTIRDIIKTGRVYYEEIRINQKGIKNKVSENNP